jgi:4-hydroxybenzoate polyprenyltransferase
LLSVIASQRDRAVPEIDAGLRVGSDRAGRMGAVTVTGERPALADVLALGRPWFWPVSLLPYYVGVLLATHRLLPPVADLPRLAAGGLVAGPLVWLAVLAINDVHDLPGDDGNPRKANAPLTSRRMSVTTARAAAGTAGVLAVLVAVPVGWAFAAGTLVALLLGWAYSAPPVRLKERPGLDVAVNALAVGALGPYGGWAAVHGIGGFPWVMAVQGTLVGVALYVPTTLADHGADADSGYRTVAVRLGPRRAYRLGLVAWLAAAGWSALLAATGTMIPRRMLWFELVMVPVLVVAYHLLLRRRASFGRIVVVSLLFLAPSVVFALTYTGLL